jgi:hypothetical protein
LPDIFGKTASRLRFENRFCREIDRTMRFLANGFFR